VAEGVADVGLVPVFEVDRLGLAWFPSLGIASRGAVRSILLISKVHPKKIKTLAADSGSRTSVQLARIILAERHGCLPELTTAAPIIDTMLESADAALLIGDAALSVDPVECGLTCLDLGEEWTDLTGLPMVFAVWAGRQQAICRRLSKDPPVLVWPNWTGLLRSSQTAAGSRPAWWSSTSPAIYNSY
jgi:predicted solute-binding protein